VRSLLKVRTSATSNLGAGGRECIVLEPEFASKLPERQRAAGQCSGNLSLSGDAASPPLGRRPMTEEKNPRAYLIFTGTGPILVLSTYEELTDERLVKKLRYKGIDRFLAYEVDGAAVKDRYSHSYDDIVNDLRGVEDLRVLDFNGHQIMANFSLEELGEPIKFSG
jgi:hypothetical protein